MINSSANEYVISARLDVGRWNDAGAGGVATLRDYISGTPASPLSAVPAALIVNEYPQ
jgi:hypothetical protein